MIMINLISQNKESNLCLMMKIGNKILMSYKVR